MTRFVVYGLDNKSQGEFTGKLACRWTVEGSLSISGDGQTTLEIPDDVAAQPWLDLRRMVVAYPESLLPWAAVLDTPWKATSPVNITLYSQAYLLSLRAPTMVEMFDGDIFEIAQRMIERINGQEDLFVRLGNTSGDDITRVETLDMRSYWEQLRALATRAGKEIFLRPQEDSDGVLMTYVDILERVGSDIGFLYHDGENANIQVLDATVDGNIINALTGIGSQNTSQSRLMTEPQVNQDSVDIFGMSSATVQFQNVSTESTLLRNTQTQLAYTAWPKIRIPFKILDVGEALQNARPGNDCWLHVGNLFLPGGRRAYRGRARLTALAYDENDRTVAALAEADDER